MIPVELKIRGLYSYQEEQVIDFKKLTDANIFGIFGSVGSGKSAILEAITLALFGETERLNKKEGRNYNIMNLKSDELYIELVFKSGKKNDEYKAIVKIKRNSKKFDKVSTPERSLLRKEEGEWFPVNEKIEKIIGLSYDNFKRTVIIPQGKFQEFLQLGKKDRREMMKELFDLQKYELWGKVSRLEDKDNDKINTLNGQVHELGDIDIEMIKEEDKKLINLKKSIKTMNQKLKENQEQLKELKDLMNLFERKEEEEEKLNSLKKKKEFIDNLENNIREFENCSLKFKDLIERKKRNKQNIDKLSKNIREDSSRLNIVVTDLENLEIELKEINIDYSNREELKQQSEDFERIVELKNLNTLLKSITEKTGLDKKHVQSSQKNLDDLIKKSKDISNHIRTSKEKLPDLRELLKIKEWYKDGNSIISEIKKNENEKNAINDNINIIKDKIRQEWTNPSLGNIPQSFNQKAIEIELNKKKNNIEKKVSDIDTVIEGLVIQKKLDEFTKEIKNSEPCPLCGSKIHPDILDIPNVDEKLKTAEEKKKIIEEEDAMIDKILMTLRTYFIELQHIETDLQKAIDEENNLKNREENHKKLFVWNEYKVEKDLIDAYGKAKTIQENIDDKEKELENLSAKIDTIRDNNEKIRENLNSSIIKKTEIKTKISTISGQLQLLSFDDNKDQPVDVLKKKSSLLTKRYMELENDLNRIKKLISEKEVEKGEVLAKLKLNKDLLGQVNIENSILNVEISDKLIEYEYNDIIEVEKILKQNIDLKKDKLRVENFKQELNLVLGQLKIIKKKIGSKEFSAEEYKELKEILEELTKEQDMNKKEQGRIESEILEMKRKLESLIRINKELTALNLRGDNLEILKSLFIAGGFVNYISSIYLTDLWKAADSRFNKLTKQSLNLEITDDNDFQVRDLLNGGKLRHIKTLSGGQTFQASLSLAIALADSIKKSSGQDKNFFFMDEGFGTLDKDSLNIVFDTLRALQKENRIVGVISHVSEMKEEIDTYLEIVNKEETGSQIKTSWGN